MKNILITGALGNIGYILYKTIQKKYPKFNILLLDKIHYFEKNYIRCDISSFYQLEKIFENNNFDFVFHLAGEFGRWNGEDYFDTMWQTNVIGTKNLIKIQEKKKFKMLFASSSEVYGDYNGLMTEDVVTSKFIRPMNDYATSKLVNEIQILNSKDMYNTDTVRVRIFNTYGPGEYYNSYRSVVSRFVYSALHNLNYTVYLNHKRTATFISDMVNGIINVFENFTPGEVYNLAGDDYHDIKELSDIILRKLKKNDSIVKYVNFEKFTTLDKKTSNKKAKELIGFKPTVNLEEGIQKTINWMQDIYIKKIFDKEKILDYC
jgi:dTDP-glucose 4,6-dehydratase